MKKIMTLAAMALCTITLCLTSCSKDDNGDKELSTEKFIEEQTKILNIISGEYKALIHASGKNGGLFAYSNLTIDKNGQVVCKDFRYEALSLGISELDNNEEAIRLRSALTAAPTAPLSFRLLGDPKTKNPADFYALPIIKTTIKNDYGTYNIIGHMKTDVLRAHYDAKTSSLTMTFIINKLSRLIERQGHSEYKDQTKFTHPVEFEISTLEKKK